eukprot:CAMPEP_0198232124 /NCGR_PEP_ID=MMETSP1445-20131203/115563_1 /TAXON_ID=36898 /ORGANISM="Pyramimonas sp., Strain CCMP2087" /LENGTH=202 /DNA_ID=CAMNT_0043912775 /DNA_START=381 /DNA_END=989 /DNA_ORIENTATION=+
MEQQQTPEKVNQVREALKAMCAMEAKLQDRCGALTDFPQSYVCTMATTDFKAKLQVPERNQTIEQNEEVKKFERKIWNVHHEGEAMPGEEDEEIAVLGSNIGDYRNAKCPLSGVDIHDLKDPVEDAQQIIYEKDVITTYLKKRNNTAQCPHQGTMHMVHLNQLRPCIQLLRERKKRQLATSQGIQLNKRTKLEDEGIDLDDE